MHTSHIQGVFPQLLVLLPLFGQKLGSGFQTSLARCAPMLKSISLRLGQLYLVWQR